MTAPVITDGITRIPLIPGSNASVNGDKIATLPLVHRAPGQLWQREAEREPIMTHRLRSAQSFAEFRRHILA